MTRVSQPVELIEPQLVEMTGRRSTVVAPNEETTSPNWSAGEMHYVSGVEFLEVEGGWKVPAVSNKQSQNAYSCTWVGIDGDGLSDLFQAGTGQDMSSSGTPNYYAWLEYLPFDPYQVGVSNLTVHANDAVSVSIFVGNSSFQPTAIGNYGGSTSKIRPPGFRPAGSLAPIRTARPCSMARRPRGWWRGLKSTGAILGSPITDRSPCIRSS